MLHTIYCHCSVLVLRYTLYYLFTPSLHVSALLGHLQVLITMLDCHTVTRHYHTKNNMQHKQTKPAGAVSIKQQERNMNTAAMNIGHIYTTLDNTQ
jgi:hypothetical protein